MSFRGRRRIEPIIKHEERSLSKKLSSTRNSTSFNLIAGVELDGTAYKPVGGKSKVETAKRDNGNIIGSECGSPSKSINQSTY